MPRWEREETRSWGAFSAGSVLRFRAAMVGALVAVLFTLCSGAAQFAHAQVESVLYSFKGSDGFQPYGGLVMDPAGNLYGTTYFGGSSYSCVGGCGTVFELLKSTGYREKVLHDFNTGRDGHNPSGGLVRDSAGDLYGTTARATLGRGTVFELVYNKVANSYTEKILHNFNGRDGQNPSASMIMGPSGNLYGTTTKGGSEGQGTVFKLATRPHGTG